MAQDKQISGTAVAAASAGGVLIYAALRNVTPLQALKDVLSGKPLAVPSTAGTKISDVVAGQAAQVQAATGGLGSKIVTAARQYIGVPYRWGGATPAGFDCSGLVTYVLHHDLGLVLPSNAHTVTMGFLYWRGATTIPASQRQPGDLVCWTGHIAIYSGNGKMIEAPHAGAKVRETNLRSAGAVFRRVNTQPGGPVQGGGV